MNKFVRFLVVISVMLLAYGCTYTNEPSDSESLKAEFRDEFGIEPAEGTVIKVKILQVGDDWQLWMVVVGDDQLYKQIISEHFERLEITDSLRAVLFGRRNAPSWWPKRFPDGLVSISKNTLSKAAPPVSEIYCWRDAKKSEIYWSRRVSK
jgi:hypothetical protein